MKKLLTKIIGGIAAGAIALGVMAPSAFAWKSYGGMQYSAGPTILINNNQTVVGDGFIDGVATVTGTFTSQLSTYTYRWSVRGTPRTFTILRGVRYNFFLRAPVNCLYSSSNSYLWRNEVKFAGGAWDYGSNSRLPCV